MAFDHRQLGSPLLLVALLTTPLCTCAETTTPEFASSFETQSTQLWNFPLADGQASRFARPSQDSWNLSRSSRLTIFAARQRVGAAVRLRWVIVSRIGGEYCMAPPVTVGAGRNVPVSVDLRPGLTQLIPSGHQRPWDSLSAAEITGIELRAECVALPGAPNDTAALSLTHCSLEALTKSTAVPILTDLSLGDAPKGYRAGATLRFRIDPEPEDPFAASGDGDVRVELPTGEKVLAFLDQDYAFADDGVCARRVPIGRPIWRAYLPAITQNGALTISGAGKRWTVNCAGIQSAGGNENFPDLGEDGIDLYGAATAGTRPSSAIDDERVVRSSPAQLRGPDGVVKTERWIAPSQVTVDHENRISNAPQYWTLTHAGAWHPAPTMAAPLAKSAFRPVLFWNPKWGNFGGASRPDWTAAMQMDSALANAAATGAAQPLVILDGEALERNGVFNWDTHPLRDLLKGPGELFRTAQGFSYSTRTMRYCIARWGLSKAISAFWITADISHPGAPLFHAKLASLLAAWPLPKDLPVISTNALACDPAQVAMVGNFEPENRSPLNRWDVDKFSPPAVGSLISGGSDGVNSYQLVSNDPRSTQVALVDTLRLSSAPFGSTAPDNFAEADSLLFDVWIPPEAPADLRIGIHLRDRNGFWFQALLPGMARPGDWTTYALDITGRNSQKLTPVLPRKLWTDYSRQRITELGLHVYSTHPNWSPGGIVMPLTARFDNIRAVRFTKEGQPAPPLTIARIVPTPAGCRQPKPEEEKETVFRGELWQCHVKVSKTFSNPFDPCECDLTAVVTTPSGKQVRVPAFFDQLCERREKTSGGEEIVEPVGEEFFTVRFRAHEPGPHQVTFELREHGKYERKVAETQHDTRFTQDGRAKISLGGHWPTMQYDRDQNGQRPVERVRFAPGQLTASVKLEAPFVVADQLRPGAKPYHGFVRVASDKRHFALDDGTFYYPMGPCLRSPSDSRLPYSDPKWTEKEIKRIGARGTFQYDDYIKSFGENGINWARVWMCPWWGALEWRRDWPGYQGFGRYNLLNAWRIDHILASAEQSGIKIDLGLTNHGQFTLDIDTEWKDNPYNAQLGGPLTAPCEFFTRADAKIAEMNKLRYVVARYSHSPSLFCWSLCSEMEFTEEYETHVRWRQDDTPAKNISDWTREMATYLKSIDPNKHLVTTHFSHPMRGAGTLEVAELDIATSNAYSAFEELNILNLEDRHNPEDQHFDAAEALANFWGGNRKWCDIPGIRFDGFVAYQKPGLVEEQGRHWMGFDQKTNKVNNTKEQLDADLHAGLWGSMVQPLGGATGYWWWLHIHFDNRYGDYKALANFMEGEDMRPAPGESMLEPVLRSIEAPNHQTLLGRALRSDRRMYSWIYHPGMPQAEQHEVSGATIGVTKFKAGNYTVEYWDTYKGTLIEKVDAVVNDENGKSIQLKLPVVKNDIAIKIKPKN